MMCSNVWIAWIVGIFTGDNDPDDQKLFVVEKRCFLNLCKGLLQHCNCNISPCWQVASFIQVRCIMLYVFRCYLLDVTYPHTYTLVLDA